jgi:hypothetical protein
MWAQDVVLAVTGLPHSDRNQLQMLVENAGGRYSKALSREITHLVASTDKERSEKLAVAIKRHQKYGFPHIVSPSWLMDSSRLGWRLGEENYGVKYTAQVSKPRSKIITLAGYSQPAIEAQTVDIVLLRHRTANLPRDRQASSPLKTTRKQPIQDHYLLQISLALQRSTCPASRALHRRFHPRWMQTSKAKTASP